MRKIDTIVVHHSGNTDTPEKIKDLHVNKNGWEDIGYHYMISRDGEIIEGRSPDKIGAHVNGFNESSIGICLLGNFDIERSNEAQLGALRKLILQMMYRFDLSSSAVSFHRDFPNAGKTCPGENITRGMVRC